MNETVFESLFFVLLPLLATLVAIKLLKPLAVRFNLVDHPGGRKTHQGSPPLIGGAAIFAGYAITWALYLKDSPLLLVFTCCAAIIVTLGVIDDMKNLPVRTRLLVQVLVALLMCWGTQRYLATLGNLLGFGVVDLGVTGLVITCLAVVGAINAFNMVDGIDGLAGSLALTTLASLAFMLSGSSQVESYALALTLAVCLLPYLAANLGVPPFKGKIFMGDAGSMLLGFSVAWLLIQTTQTDQPAFRPVTALWIIAIPLMDMLAVMVRRLYLRQSPFNGDRGHLHHILLDQGLSPRQALLVITASALLLAIIGIVGEWLRVPEWIMFWSAMAVFVGYSTLIIQLKKPRVTTPPSLQRASNVKRLPTAAPDTIALDTRRGEAFRESA